MTALRGGRTCPRFTVDFELTFVISARMTKQMDFEAFFRRVQSISGVTTQKDLAHVLGIEPAAISLAKSRGVPRIWVLALAERFGLHVQWLVSGDGPVYAGTAGVFHVPCVAARACAGGGSFDCADAVIGELPFERSWLARLGNPARMVAMDVVGDSMSPEIESGDTLLIDRSQNVIVDNRIFVFGVGESLQVKRAHVHPGLVVLFSTNPRYAPVTLQGDEVDTLRVIGRVLWSSRAYA